MLLLRNGNIHLISGEIKSNTDILIEGKLIKKIGQALASKDVQFIDVSGKEVFAGFIAPCTSIGLIDFTNSRQGDNNETTDPITPQLNVKYALDKREINAQQYYYSGITAFGAAPGVNNIISGQVGVYNTAGQTIKDMCIKEFAALKGNFAISVKNAYGKRGAAPMTKMGIASILRNALLDAKQYLEKEEKTIDEKKETMGKILMGEVPFLVNASTAAEIDGISHIAQEFGLRLVIHNAFQPEKCAKAIMENHYPVLLGQLQTSGYAVSYKTDFSKIIEMQKQGAIIGLSNSGDAGFAGRETLLWSAIKMVQAGADAEDGIKMITIHNAIALGVDDIIGSLEENKQADIVIYDGHPLKTFKAKVEYSIIGGEIVYKNTGGFVKCC
jgi:imidazolonepropionase-like amidohydrolase